MPYVLAIEPHQGQAGILRHDVSTKSRATVTVVDSMEAAMTAIDDEVPQLVLVSALMPPHEEGALLARLRDLPPHTAPQILITPALEASETAQPRRTLLHRLRNRSVLPAGCDPSAFADQLSAYLDHAERRRQDPSRSQTTSFVPRPMKSGANRRAAVRFERLDWAQALVDGATVDLVDLSFTGAQVLAPTVLRPGGAVQVLLSRQSHTIQCEAGIVWGGFEIVGPTRAPWYRAGMSFKDADRGAVERFYFERD